MNVLRRLRGCGTSSTPTPSPTPTPSAATHNSTTPANAAYTVTNWSELSAAVADRRNGINSGVPIVLRGPAGGSTAGAYDGPSNIMNLNPSDTMLGTPLLIRAADLNDKPIWRGPVGSPPAVLTGWVYLPGNVTVQGINFLDRNGTAGTISYITSYYTLANMIYDRCYVQGQRNVSDGFGTTGATRFMRASGKANMSLTNSVFDGIQCGLYADAGASSLLVDMNSVLRWGDHFVQTGGSVDGLAMTNNLFQAPEPGYDGVPADPYVNHGGAAYFGGVLTDVLQNITIANNFLASLVDQSHAYLARVAWSDTGDGVPGHEPTPANAKNIAIYGNKTRGGTNAAIVLNSVAGIGNTVHDNDVRTITPAVEISANTIDSYQSVYSYYNNAATHQPVGSTVDTSGGGNTSPSATISAAAALAEMEAWALAKNIRTISVLGI